MPPRLFCLSSALLVLAACASAPGTAPETASDADFSPGTPTAAPRVLDPARIVPSGGRFVAQQTLMGITLQFSESGTLFAAEEGQTELRLVGLGRESQFEAVSYGTSHLTECGLAFDAADHCLPRLERTAGPAVEWWDSGPGQVQVGWDLAEPPAGSGLVLLALEFTGASVEPTPEATGVEVLFGDRSLLFAGLAAYDDAGVALPAWFESDGERLSLYLDDAGATYPIHIDPSSLSSLWSATGSSSTGEFGWDATGIGDVNRDGYADVAVLQRSYTSGSYSGRVLVYYGSSTGPATSASQSYSASSTLYGYTDVAPAGDVNNDGYDDFLVGAGSHNGTEGAFQIFHGSSTGLSSSAARTVKPGVSGRQFGASVAGAGDVNHDGYDDILVGSPQFSSSTGAAYVYLGSSSGIGTSAATTLSGSADSQFGFSVSFAGDVNGDDYDDVLVAGPYSSISTGYVKLYLGSSSGLSTSAASTFTGSAVSEAFGYDVEGVGDVNNDGYDDIAIGSDAPSSQSPDVLVFHGSSSGLGASYATKLTTPDGQQRFGRVVAGLGDMNNDGYDDIAVSHYYCSTGSLSNNGCAYVYTGSASGISTTAAAVAAGASANSGLSFSLDAAGDVDGDGIVDLIAGTPYYAGYYGYVLVFKGASDADGDGYTSGTTSADDCDDANSSIHPGATETVGDGIDYNCDAAESCYDDDDDDGYLSTAADTRSSTDTDCDDANEGDSSTLTTDCNDFAGSVFPGATETPADAVDQDCDGSDPCFDDDDNDGYLDSSGDSRANADSDCNDAFEGTATDLTTDCDDTTAAIKPGATEGVGDGVDQDCNGHETCFDDDDDDGYVDSAGDTRDSTDLDCTDSFEASATTLTTDCDDFDDTAYPDNTEVVGDGVDQSCDGIELCYHDDDNDGYLDTSGDTRASSDRDCDDGFEGTATDLTTDCDDATATINPVATEVIGDEVDQDCDGKERCYEDDDGDGYRERTGANTVDSSDADCGDANEAPATAPATDCDDEDAAAYPGATETPGDAVDQDCDGDEVCFYDSDNDGYLDTSGNTVASNDIDCLDAYEGTADDPTTDCDDGIASAYPGAPEVVANGIDEDCGGGETCYEDTDGDHYGTIIMVESADLDCDDGTESSVATDCDDTIAATYPGAPELAVNAVDDDCDGYESCYVDADGDAQSDGSTVASADLSCTDLALTTLLGDCDDTDNARYSGATELIVDGIDSDCDGAERCYVDDDVDSFGSETEQLSTDLSCTEAGVSPYYTDCNDTDAEISPAASEGIADGLDSNCDNVESCWLDEDFDGHGVNEISASSDFGCTTDGNAVIADDCDDTADSRYPDAIEIPGDEIDQSCDGTEECFHDADDDGYLGDSGATIVSTGVDCSDAYEGKASDPTGDCNDTDGSVSPAAIENTADGVDSNCDGLEACYLDADGDGFGSGTVVSSSALACDGPNESNNAEDCDDATAGSYPGASEIVADGVDQNCDTAESCYLDGDQDSFGSTTTVESSDLDCSGLAESAVDTDCDDGSANAYPEAPEVVANGIDEDCGGGDTCYQDTDGDTFGTTTLVESADLTCVEVGESLVADDCDDGAVTVFPGATESAANAVDDDCDGAEICYTDSDGDGQSSGSTAASTDLACGEPGLTNQLGDCADDDSARYTGAVEAIADGVDSDCDGVERCYADVDLDSFGGETEQLSSDSACGESGVSALSTDCNDGDAGVSPAASEVTADGIDGNCDGIEFCWVDSDVDGHGIAESVAIADVTCATSGASLLADDCDDADATRYPGAAEVPASGVDEDCDGLELCFADTDGDGFGGTESQESVGLTCTEAGESALATDCDDTNRAISPAEAEVCNGLDDNCEGTSDEGFDADADGTADCLEEVVDEDAGDSGLKDEREGNLCGCGTEAPISALALTLVGMGMARRRRLR